MMPMSSCVPHRSNLVDNLFIGRAPSQRPQNIVAFGRKEAEIELAVGGQTGACAASAERLRDRADDAEFAGAVAIAIALRDLAETRRPERLDRPLPRDAAAAFQ